jgi:flagellar hook-basal body complex protein FliE
MSTAAINSILSEIRTFNPQGAGAALDVAPGTGIDIGKGGAVGKAPGFADTMSRMLDGVSASQNRSGELARAFEMGDPGVDLARLMVQSQQAQVAFRATVEVRNRVVSAYQEIMGMPI